MSTFRVADQGVVGVGGHYLLSPVQQDQWQVVLLGLLCRMPGITLSVSYRVSAGTGWSSVSLLWPGEIVTLSESGSLSNCQNRSIPEIYFACGCIVRPPRYKHHNLVWQTEITDKHHEWVGQTEITDKGNCIGAIVLTCLEQREKWIKETWEQ